MAATQQRAPCLRLLLSVTQAEDEHRVVEVLQKNGIPLCFEARAKGTAPSELLDAIGLGAFSVVGVQTAVGRGFLENGFLCVVMGMTTGVVGGILRDVLGGITPAVLRKRIYAVASLMGAWLYYELTRLNVDGSASVLAGMGLTLAIRMLAAHYQWRLPKVPHP